jgi:hypothetical protein
MLIVRTYVDSLITYMLGCIVYRHTYIYIQRVSIWRVDFIGYCEKNVRMYMCLIPSGYQDRAV